MQMEVILLRNLKKLGKIGDVVNVAMGYARYLLRQNLVLRSSAETKEEFELKREHFEKLNMTHKEDALTLAETLDGKAFILTRQAGDSGHLYGSVSGKDIVDMLVSEGFPVDRASVILAQPIKILGVYEIPLELHAEVKGAIHVIVSKTLEEGEQEKKRFLQEKPPLLSEEA